MVWDTLDASETNIYASLARRHEQNNTQMDIDKFSRNLKKILT